MCEYKSPKQREIYWVEAQQVWERETWAEAQQVLERETWEEAQQVWKRETYAEAQQVWEREIWAYIPRRCPDRYCSVPRSSKSINHRDYVYSQKFVQKIIFRCYFHWWMGKIGVSEGKVYFSQRNFEIESEVYCSDL